MRLKPKLVNRNYICLLALGDVLISLSLLAKIDKKITILGTQHTKNIIDLIGLNNQFHLVILFDNIPAFYDVKNQGIIKAIKDLYIFIRYIRQHKIKELVLEKKDFRSNIIKFFTNTKLYFPNSTDKVYIGRKNVINNLYNANIDLNSYQLNISNPKTIIINPLTRESYRNIKNNHLQYILDELSKYNYEIYLLDTENKYSKFQNKVNHYLTNTTLEDVKNLLNKCDLYIGGDSFLIHLAYYLKRNYFMIFYRDNDDFMPPNIEDNFYIKAHNSNNFELEIQQKFENIGLLK
jgi:ADP-heptose:LPS heptosyltransferase